MDELNVLKPPILNFERTTPFPSEIVARLWLFTLVRYGTAL